MCEVEVYYFTGGTKTHQYSHRKFLKFNQSEAILMYNDTIKKLKSEGVFAIIAIRDEQGWMVASERVNF